MGWLHRVNKVLTKEPETWLEYLGGHQWHSFKHLKSREPRFKGAFLRSLIWCYTLARETSLRFQPRPNECKYLVFAGTFNQKSSLDSTVTALKRKNQDVLVVYPSSAKWYASKQHSEEKHHAIVFGPLELLKSLFLLPLRFLSIYYQLKKIDPVLIEYKFDKFLQTHRILVYCDRLLALTKPRFIIVSNDHNVQNRILLALARERGVKTVYMQHASVSDLFPALNVDYAFLDGQAALETYLQCECNFPPNDPPILNRKVFLSGQKKEVATYSPYQKRRNVVGLALNSLDKIENVVEVVQYLSGIGVHVKVRWHPGLGEVAINDLLQTTKPFLARYSDPSRESISSFLESIGCLIAGNSSIHLEAVLAGVITIYYEITVPEKPDYYSYVKNGLAIPAQNLTSLTQCLDDIMDGCINLNREAVQYYSATFGTEWEGREGELVTKILVSLDKGELPPVSSIKL